MEYSQIKVVNHINEKRARMLETLKTLKDLLKKEKYCEQNYQNFIESALSNECREMSEKDSLKFYRLGSEINSVLIRKKEIVEKFVSKS
jgi:hypothetical protein